MSHADTVPIRLALPRASDERSIEWATRDHRSRQRTTTVSQRSHRGAVLRHTFVNTQAETDDRLDSPPHSGRLQAMRNRGHRRPLRYTLLRKGE